MLKKLIEFFLFSSLFIAVCAVLMSWQTIDLLKLGPGFEKLLAFIFFSTILSYNVHWCLSRSSTSEQQRSLWNREHYRLQIFLILTGLAGALFFGWLLREDLPALAFAAVLSFFYTAPKIPAKIFEKLKKIAYGKTLFLAFVWTYVTTLLPIIISSREPGIQEILFILQRFFLIYAICILFDFRDRQQDKIEGIKSLITVLPEKRIDYLFALSILLFAFSVILMSAYAFEWPILVALLIPGGILTILYPYAKKNHSDFLYYGILDGLMMASALITSFPVF